MADNIINLENITVTYDGEKVLKGISLYIRDKEFVTLLGPSGCGKTTTLRIIGGFVEPDSGDVFFDGKKINDLPPHKRQVNTVFQRYALFPHLNVYDNIAFGLRVQKMPEDEIKERVLSMLKLVNLEGYQRRKISKLSGGQQQRIAIARALVNRPRVLLLDEPLGALDLQLRKEMQIELKRMQQQLDITFIYVTHDQEEALTMSDTIVVMNNGTIQQIGTPEDIYNEPKNTFVAKFIGASNIINGVMLEDYKVAFADRIYECVDKGFTANEEVDVVIRPEDIKIVAPTEEYLTGFVESVTFKGVHYEMIVDSYDMKWTIHSTKSAEEGSFVGLNITPEDIHIMRKSENIADAIMVDNNVVSIQGKTYECDENSLLYNESVEVQISSKDVLIVEPSDDLICGEIEAINKRSVFIEVVINTGEKKWISHTTNDALTVGQRVGITFDSDDIYIIRTVESELSATTEEEDE
ncbi:MAG: ABC transporter ATP-binding protein [Clostridia bacterium]|nr:ABC transporter ATP-binding protein [Clostridia bacterium]